MTRKIPLLLMLLFFLKADSLTAQLFNCTRYTITDGLVANNIRKIFQDSRGFIWIGTWNGLSRYDGHKFINYTEKNGLKHGMINELFEWRNGELLVAQNDGTVGVLENGRLDQVLVQAGDTINYLMRIDENELLSISPNSLYRWDGNTIKRISHTTQNLPLFASRINDSILIGHENNIVRLYDDNFRIISKNELSGCRWIFLDSKKRAWICTDEGLKLVSVAGILNKQLEYERSSNGSIVKMLAGKIVSYAYEDTNGTIWIGTLNGMYSIYKNGNVEKYSKNNGLPSDIITYITQDREKNIWIGTSAGLAKIPQNNALRIIGTNEGLNSHMEYSMLEVDSTQVLLFSKLKTKLNPMTGEIKQIGKLNQLWLPHFDLRKNEILTFENDKAFLYKKGNPTGKQVPWPASMRFHSLLKLNDSTYISGLREGFTLVQNNRYWSDTSSLPYRVTCLAKDNNGQIWAGTFAHGLYQISYTLSDTNFKIQARRMFEKEIPDERIRSMYIDSKQNIWIGARYRGAFCIQPEVAGNYRISHYNQDAGLSADWVNTFEEDSVGNIWLGTAQGIDKLLPQNNSYRIYNFGKINRIAFPVNTIKCLPGGQLLAAGLDGLVIAHDDELEKLTPGKVYITNTKADFLPSGKSDIQNEKKLSYKNSGISFEFASPQYFNEDIIHYSYRLLGTADSSWVLSDNSQAVNYANLQPGKYRFDVRVAGENGDWSSPASFQFSVNKPFWLTPWFIALIILLIAAFFYTVYRYRIAEIMRLQNVRNAIASDLHDEIGSTLTNINILSSLSRKNIERPKEAQNFLGRISEEVGITMQALDDIIWSVNSKNDSMGESVSRMRRYAAELFDAGQIDYNIEMNENLEEKKLSMQQRRDLYMLYKEIVNNIYKHAAASKVDIQLGISENKIQMKVADDGVGYNPGMKTTRNGLKNMQQRVQKWHGTIQVNTSPGKGTHINISFPIVAP